MPLRKRSREQLAAIHAKLRQTTEKYPNLTRRAAVGAAVLAGGAAVHAVTRNARARGIANKIMLAAASGTGAAAFSTLRDRAERMALNAAAAVPVAGDLAREGARAAVEAGSVALRTIPVEALAAKGVDLGFQVAESSLHEKASALLNKAERRLGKHLGGVQAVLTERLAERARRGHRTFFPQPRSKDDLNTIRDYTERLRIPTLTSLRAPKSLRTGHIEQKIGLAADDAIRAMQRGGQLEMALAGFLDPESVIKAANNRGLKDSTALLHITGAIQRKLRGMLQ